MKKNNKSEEKNFNNRHPELHRGEVFCTNIVPVSFDRVRFKTKRMGILAYDMHGIPLPGFVPVFISLKEARDFIGEPTKFQPQLAASVFN